MVESELQSLIAKVQRRGCEWQTTEVKAAHQGCPEKLYDTLSSFSNQDDGGVILFGLDETDCFAEVGVYDAQDLQKKVMEYGEQMTPVVRPVFTICDRNGKVFVSAEIPPIDLAERPCFKTAKGRLKGSYTRVGDADKPMTEYEVYSYEVFRKNLRDDVRPIEGIDFAALNRDETEAYLALKRREKPNLAKVTEEQQYVLNGVLKDGSVTMAALLLFGLYPQAIFPRLCINATCIPGTEKGETDAAGNRFTDSRRIEGTLPEMLEGAMEFVGRNMRTATRIDPRTGRRSDVPQYPMLAVREAVLNALVHRDYSVYNETKPIQLDMYADRMEITNPGGLYGRLTLDCLGHSQPDTRNPVLVTAMESLGQTENRYSGIPTIRRAMAEACLPEPLFSSSPGEFKVVFRLAPTASVAEPLPALPPQEKGLLEFCRTPRTRAEIMAFLRIDSGYYALRRYLDPLVKAGLIRMTLPDAPRSHKQRYVTEQL